MNSLKLYNTYKINAQAKFLYFPKSIEEIAVIYGRHQHVVLLGNGSNIILADHIYLKTAFIILNKEAFSKLYLQEDGSVYAQAAVLLKELSIFAYNNSLSGVETFFDVPATIGGAIIMNTGAYGDEIYDYIEYVDVYCLTDRYKKRFMKDDIKYGYRYSYFKGRSFVVIGACFNFKQGEKKLIKEKTDNILAQRRKKLPKEPSAGSVFKRPKYQISVGEMIEEINLKGYQIGGAQISLQHGGIIINKSVATGQDILNLIEFIIRKIKQHYNVNLELEQIIIRDHI